MSRIVQDRLNANFTPNSAPGRALNANFTPSASRPVLVIYSVRIACDDGDEGRVELRSDTAATPTTNRCRVAHLFSVAGLLGVTGDGAGEYVLTYLVPKNHNVRLVTTTVAGTPTFSIVTQTEIPL